MSGTGTDSFDAGLSPMDFFRDEMGRISTSDAANCRWFVSSFGRFIGDRSIAFSDIDGELVESYRRHLVEEGLKATTIRRYCERFRSLYNKAVKKGLAPKSGAFDAIGSCKESSVPRTLSGSGRRLDAVRTVASFDFSSEPLFEQTQALFLFSLYACGMPFSEMASLRKGSIRGGRLVLASGASLPLLPGMIRIVSRYEGWDTDYLLPVLRSGMPVPDMSRKERSYLHNVEGIFRKAGMACAADADLSLRLWIEIGLELGISSEVILSALSKVPDGSSLRCVEVGDAVGGDRVDGAVAKIAESIKDCSESWYAMRLRPDASYDRVASVLKREFGADASALYYPCEEIVRRVGKKLTVRTRSVIRNVVFFRASHDSLPVMARSLAEMAWIYRTGRSADSGYAVVPEYELYKFRAAVSRFTDDMDFMPADRAEWRKGRDVRITGGSLEGYEGKIVDMEPTQGGCRREILVRITTDAGIKVIAEIPDIFIEAL